MPQIIAYTDGAASNNADEENRCGGWAVVMLYFNDDHQQVGETKPLSGTLKGATNNMMELEAIRRALMMVKKDKQNILIYSDSQYAIGVLSKNWKPKANQTLIHEIKVLMLKHTKVEFRWIEGHAGNEHNERADRLAVAATQRCTDDMDDSEDVKRFSSRNQQSMF